MARFFRILTVSVLLLVASVASAQTGVDLAAGPVPRGSTPLVPLETIPTLTVPSIDVDRIRKDDLWWVRRGMPARYAAPYSVAVTPRRHGRWEALGEDVRLWRLRIASPGALSLNLGFSRFRLPRGARLYLYAPDGRHEIGPFTARDNESHGQLWTPPLPTDELVLELTVPTARQYQVQLELGVVNHGFAGFGAADPKAGACNLDVACEAGAAWEAEARSVGLISVAGTYFCTGFLVNNTEQDGRPLLMTAQHCGINAGNAASVVVFWNHQRETCGERRGGEPVPQVGTKRLFQTGAVHRAEDALTDIALLELDDPLDASLDLTLAGWDRRHLNPNAGAVIHHPGTDAKRISLDSDALTTTSYLKERGPGNGSHLRVGGWEAGTTEEGSSGAPLFNAEHRVVGLLHGGSAHCGDREAADWFGRLSIAWDGGTQPENRLRDWLDPAGTGAWVLDSASAASVSRP